MLCKTYYRQWISKKALGGVVGEGGWNNVREEERRKGSLGCCLPHSTDLPTPHVARISEAARDRVLTNSLCSFSHSGYFEVAMGETTEGQTNAARGRQGSCPARGRSPLRCLWVSLVLRATAAYWSGWVCVRGEHQSCACLNCLK